MADSPPEADLAKLREQAELYRLLVEDMVDHAIFLLDVEGNVRTWNAGAEAIKGYHDAEIIGKHFSLFYSTEDRARGAPENVLRTARETGRYEGTGWRYRKDGTRFWANVIVTPVRNREGALIGYAKLTRDLTDTRRIETLEESSQQLTHFLAVLAHELRNPLAPIRNAVNVLEMTKSADPTEKWSRAVITRQVTHLTRLVDDLLDVSRIISGRITLHQDPVQMSSIIERAIESAHPLIEARKHRFQVLGSTENIWVYGDVIRLAQVVSNLLGNSAKFTPEHGKITLKIRGREKVVDIVVSDSGVGLTRQAIDSMFDPFSQGERTPDSAETGLGIGLTLVKKLVEMHGGSVTAESEGEHKGSTFTVTLPRIEAPTSSSSRRSPSAEKPVVASLNVMVVDDNRDAADTLSLLLRLWGHNATVFYNGHDAIAAARELQLDVVFLDIGMPGLDGYELARRLRTMKTLRHTALVAVTGFGMDEDKRRTAEAGFHCHLVKPVDVNALIDCLSSIKPASEKSQNGNPQNGNPKKAALNDG